MAESDNNNVNDKINAAIKNKILEFFGRCVRRQLYSSKNGGWYQIQQELRAEGLNVGIPQIQQVFLNEIVKRKQRPENNKDKDKEIVS